MVAKDQLSKGTSGSRNTIVKMPVTNVLNSASSAPETANRKKCSEVRLAFQAKTSTIR